MSIRATTPSRYNELYRPQFHFSPATNWINDPNGLVYYKGEYHLFFQCHPHTTLWGPMHWGHAVSPDLIHWTPLPIALYPDPIGEIWSGSAVVDADNSSGLVPGGGLVAIFSYHDQSQGIAYSTDNGRHWAMFSGNPVLPAGGKHFRDPKVFWHPETGRWIMILAAEDRAKIYSSPNLTSWTFASEFGVEEGVRNSLWECPDLFPLELDGETQWVMIASVMGGGLHGGRGITYCVGHFDGQRFTTETRQNLWLDYGPDNYAGVTWNETPDHSRVYIGWMNNWNYANLTPTTGWRGAMTIPRVLGLRRFADGIRLIQTPVPQVEQLRDVHHSWRNQSIVPGSGLLAGLSGKTLDIVAEFQLSRASVFGFKVRKRADGSQFTALGYDVKEGVLFVDRRRSGEANFHPLFSGIHKAALAPENGRITLRILVDWSSVEVFGNHGAVAITDLIFPDQAANQLEVFSSGGDVTLLSLDIYSMKSTWA